MPWTWGTPVFIPFLCAVGVSAVRGKSRAGIYDEARARAESDGTGIRLVREGTGIHVGVWG